jgi:hypothetical protein
MLLNEFVVLQYNNGPTRSAIERWHLLDRVGFAQKILP